MNDGTVPTVNEYFCGLRYLEEQMAGMSQHERNLVHYSLVGGVSVLLDDETWRKRVDSAVSSIKTRGAAK